MHGVLMFDVLADTCKMVAMIVHSINGPQRSHSLNKDCFSFGQRTAANFVPTAERSLLIVWLIGSSKVLNSRPPVNHGFQNYKKYWSIIDMMIGLVLTILIYESP